MNPEEERLRQLIRVGHETIIKIGTYNLEKSRPIIQDHPFYVQNIASEPVDMYEPEPVQPSLSEDELATQILTSNFRTGLSQAEVDALLSAM